MPITRAQLNRIAEIRLRIHEALEVIENATAIDMLRVSENLIARLKAILKEGLAGRELEVIAEIDGLIRLAVNADANILAGRFDGVARLGVGMARFAMVELGMLNDRRALIVTQRFNADFLPELRTASYQRWLADLPETALSPASALRTTLAEGVLTGKSLNKIGADFIRRGGIYDLPETVRAVEPMARALRVARTEIARIDNDSSVLWSAAGGADKYANLGVGDDRQSEICAFATKQEPMTIKQWKALRFEGERVGMAPRHVANCRCLMIGAPRDYARIVDEQFERAGLL